MAVGGNFTSCNCGPDSAACTSPTEPVATVGLCLADGTPIAVTVVRDCAGTVTSEGWLTLTTGTWSAGAPPAGTIACGNPRSIAVSGTFCDVDPDTGDVLGLVLIEYSYAADGSIASVRLVDAVTGNTYLPQGEVTTCPAGVEQPERDMVQLCDVTDAESGAGLLQVPFLRDYQRDETGQITGHSDYTLDGAPYAPTGLVGVCHPTEAEPCASTVSTLRLCDLNPTVEPDADGKRCAVPFLRHLVHDCAGALVETRDTAMDGTTPYTPVQVVDCGSGGVPAQVEVPWTLVSVVEDPAGTVGQDFIYTLSPEDDPSTVGTVRVHVSRRAGSPCGAYDINNLVFSTTAVFTLTLDAVAQQMTYLRLDMMDFDRFEPVSNLTPPPNRLGGTATWSGTNVVPTVNDGTGYLYWDNPPAQITYRINNTGGGTACSKLAFAAMTLRPEGCCGCDSGAQEPCRDTSALLLCDVTGRLLTNDIYDSAPLATGPTRGTLPNGVTWSVNAGVWVGSSRHYIFGTGKPFPAGPQVWTFDRPAALRFGVANVDSASLKECMRLPATVVPESIHPNHVWDPVQRTLCATGSTAGSDVSIFTTTEPVTSLELASVNPDSGIGTSFIQVTVEETPQQFLRTVVTDCETGETVSVVDTTLDGDPYTVVGEVGQCQATGGGGTSPEPCRDTSSTLLCDTAATDLITVFDPATRPDADGWEVVSYTGANAGAGPEAAMPYPARYGTPMGYPALGARADQNAGSNGAQWPGYDAAPVRWVLRKTFQAPEDGVAVAQSVGFRGDGGARVRINGVDAGMYGQWNQPATAGTAQIPVTAGPNTVEIEVRDTNGINNVVGRLDIALPHTTQFMRRQTVDCETGEVIATHDTTLDGDPYTVVGEVGQCEPVAECCEQAPPEQRVDVETELLCIRDEASGDVLGQVVVERVYDDQSGDRLEQRLTDPTTGDPVELPAGAVLARCPSPDRITRQICIVATGKTEFLTNAGNATSGQDTDWQWAPNLDGTWYPMYEVAPNALWTVTDPAPNKAHWVSPHANKGVCSPNLAAAPNVTATWYTRASWNLPTDVDPETIRIAATVLNADNDVVQWRLNDGPWQPVAGGQFTPPAWSFPPTAVPGGRAGQNEVIVQILETQPPSSVPCPNTNQAGMILHVAATYDHEPRVWTQVIEDGRVYYLDENGDRQEKIPDGDRIVPCGGGGECCPTEECRDTSTVLLCDLDPECQAGIEPTATDEPHPAGYNNWGPGLTPNWCHLDTPGQGAPVWAGGSVVLGPDVKCPTASGGDTHRVIGVRLAAGSPSLTGTVNVTVSLRVTNNGPNAGYQGDGRFGLWDASAGPARIKYVNVPGNAPVGAVYTLTLSAAVPAAALAAGDIVAILDLETYHGAGPKAWLVDQFAWSAEVPAVECEAQFLRTIVKDCATGATVSVVDTTLDGEPYEVTGEVGQCTPADGGGGTSQPEPCQANTVIEACRCDDINGDGVSDVDYVELLAVDCEGTLTSIGTYTPDLSAPYTPVAPVPCETGGAPSSTGVQGHRVELAPGETWDAAAWPTLQSVTAVARGTGTVTTTDGTSSLVASESVTWSVARDSDALLTGPLTITTQTGTVAVSWTTGVNL
ncbi:hypothetical protein [Streptomyces sp. NPDC004728]|uniref:hypothetical protein n=1 Tax=Streptomyces sp. NPDC004728 TaxID=3154289 RepID=UPI0033ACC8B8